MKLFAKVAFAAAFIGSASFAGSITPSDVAFGEDGEITASLTGCLLYTSQSQRDLTTSRMPSYA